MIKEQTYKGKKRGRRKGFSGVTAERAKMLLIKEVTKDWVPLIKSLKDAALGYYYEELGKDGKMRIYKKDPDSKAAEYLINQTIGRPKESMDLTSGGEQIGKLDIIAISIKKLADDK